MNRLTSVSYNISNAPGVASTPTVTYNYDNSTDSTQGELLSVSVGSYYSESYGYDSYERPSSVTDTINGEAYTTSYQYNTANQRTQVTYPSSRVLPYLYDSFGRLNSIGGSTGVMGQPDMRGRLLTTLPSRRPASTLEYWGRGLVARFARSSSAPNTPPLPVSKTLRWVNSS
jgi:YD repeat-containing protein